MTRTETTSVPAATVGLTEQAKRGKVIYLTGTSPSGGQITAVLGGSVTEIPAAALKCVNCHLENGRGKPEGGISPSNIGWDELTKPYGSTDAQGRKRPPYNATLLKRAITMGLDSAGRSLDQAMPRYRMSHVDVADLLAYLTVVGRELDPGLSAERVRIGVILAPLQLLPEMSLAVRAAVTAFVSKVNRAGGVYQREIELCFAESPARREDRAEAAIAFVKREHLFALAASFVAGAEVETTGRLDQEGVPLVGAQTLYPQTEFPLNRRVFYVTAGLLGQCRAVMRFAQASRPDKDRDSVLLLPQHANEGDDAIANGGITVLSKSIRTACADLGWGLRDCPDLTRGSNARVLAKQLANTKAAVVFSLLTAEPNLQLLREAAAQKCYPNCFFLGDLVGRDLFKAPHGFDRRIFLAFSSLPSQLPAGIEAYSELADEFNLPSAHLAAQFESLAAIKTLIQVLQQSGAELSRERVIEQLERLREYRTGFAPPLTFGPNRRVGATGGYIVTVDLINQKLVPVSGWLDDKITLGSER
jgi:ABC-type branched-subunit amino acid transport system substrate-binding protein